MLFYLALLVCVAACSAAVADQCQIEIGYDYKSHTEGTTWGDIRPKRQKIAVTRALKRQSAVLGRFGQAARPAT